MAKVTTSKKKAIVDAKHLLIASENGGKIQVGEEIAVDAKKILLNSPQKATEPPIEDSSKKTTISLSDDEGNPLAFQRFIVRMPDGKETGGLTDASGKALVYIEEDATIVWPDLGEVKGG